MKIIRNWSRWRRLLILGAGFLIPTMSMATNIQVSKNSEINTLSKALAKAKAGDVITLKKGVYAEWDLKITKPVKIVGEPGAIIDGKNKGEIILITSDGVTIDGLEIRNVPRSNLMDHAAIRVRQSEKFVLQNLTIRNPFFGIYLEKSGKGILRNNKIYGKAENEFNSGNGIQLWYSSDNVVENNIAHQMRDGIYLEFSSRNKIKGNVSKDNVRYGLHFMFSHENRVDNNTYENNGAGIAIMFSKKVQMHYNQFLNNWGSAAYGLLLKEVTDGEITHNVFKQNTTAINLEGSNRIVYRNNDFIRNGWALNSRGANYENIFNKNNFLNNSFDIAYKGPIHDNSFNGNYWSSYSGYDLNKDGIGDIPHRPMKLFSKVVSKSPEAIIMLRSLFIDLLDFSEKVSPMFTPENLMDAQPYIKQIRHD